MKRFIFILLLFQAFYSKGQAPADAQSNNLIANIIEDYLETIEAEDFDFNTILENLNYFYEHPLDINRVRDQDLRELIILNEIQIGNFINYRNTFGDFLSIYELQAIPSWDMITIRSVLPFLTIGTSGVSFNLNFKDALSNGNSTLFLKAKRVLETRRGYIPNSDGISPYLGDPNHLYVRYRYEFGQLFRAGFTMEKDPGEQFFRGINKTGFDFYSFFINARNINNTVKEVSLGDYSISLGQGLIMHNDFGGGKSSFVLNVKRGGRMIRPYSSVNEANYFRGGAATLRLNKNLEMGFFGSYRAVNGRVTGDTLDNSDFERFTSLPQDGFHRTLSEIGRKNTINQYDFGGKLQSTFGNLKVSGNVLYTGFDKAFQRDEALYTRFLFAGQNLLNASIDYSYRYRNFTFYGESAMSGNGGLANLHGLLLGLDRKIDIAVVYRNYHPDYQVLNANAFGESTLPINEKGIYLGMEIRPFKNTVISTYIDFWQNPWASFRRDGPGSGREYFVKLSYILRRKLEFYVQYRYEQKLRNSSDDAIIIDFPQEITLHRLRVQLNYKLSKELELRDRVEFSFFDQTKSSRGIMMYQDIIYKPIASPLSFSMRYAVFDINSFDARIYTFENDLLYEFYIPFFQNRGSRYYVNLRYRLARNYTWEFRIGRTYLQNVNEIGSGNERIDGNTRTELKTQLKIRF
ncbi:MAG: helix-hairpin-helix domain-containing protein [Saprospiraceae bacterium]|nr:helix-hairpin-helix domain-containing protein [Saprospiraceae bacterium]